MAVFAMGMVEFTAPWEHTSHKQRGEVPQARAVQINKMHKFRVIYFY